MCSLALFLCLSVFLTLAYGYTPQSNTFRKQGDDGNYAFGYDIKDGKGSSNFRKEVGTPLGHKRGSYGLFDGDGRKRVVEYIADDKGFRAHVKTNEPGTEGLDTAAASYSDFNGKKHGRPLHLGKKPKKLSHESERHPVNAPRGDNIGEFIESLNVLP